MTPPSGSEPGASPVVVADPPADLPSVTRAGAGPAGGHLSAVDVVRFLTIAGVILVHATSFANSTTSLAANGVLQVFHVTRSVFLMLSAFVLTYSYQRRPLRVQAFWRRRYPLIAAPYLTWSAIYFLTDGGLHASLPVLERFLRDLSNGDAKFHLYFLLLTMQLYLVFPALMAGLRRWPRAVIPAVWGGFAFQMLFTAAVHYRWRPPVLGVWFSRPDEVLPSYAFYVIGGIAAALHFDEVTIWIRRHYRLLAAGSAATVALSIVSFLLDMSFLGYTPMKAAEVFQPANVIEAVAVTAAEFGLGLWMAERASRSRLAFLARASDVSFGLYLAHPLLLGALLDAAGWAGVTSALRSWPSGLVEALIALGLVPLLYAATFVGIDRIRRTPVSLWLTGRRGPRPVPTPAPAPS